MRSAIKTSILASSVIFIFFLLVTPQAVHATYKQFQPPSADSKFAQAAPNTNYGGDDNLLVYANPASTNNFRSVVSFDISEIPLGSTVNAAHLLLNYYAYLVNDPVGRTYYAYRVTTGSWLEMEVTWNSYKTGSPWTTAGGDYTTDGGASATVPATYQDMVWDVTSIVKAWIEQGQPNYGFLIRDAVEDNPIDMHGAYFYSKESTVGDPPRLQVDWTTSPGPTPSGAVGGVLLPTSKLTISAPYLVMIGLVGCVVTAVVVAKKRRA